jgi:hypothetical protein
VEEGGAVKVGGKVAGGAQGHTVRTTKVQSVAPVAVGLALQPNLRECPKNKTMGVPGGDANRRQGVGALLASSYRQISLSSSEVPTSIISPPSKWLHFLK